jgi:hypothetical protein
MQLDAKPALTKEGFGVVANENITSTGIVFDTVVSAFSSPASIPMLKDNESSHSVHHSFECCCKRSGCCHSVVIRSKNRPPISGAERLLVD